MPLNTVYNPQKTSDFTKDNLLFSGQSIAFDCAASSTAQGDLTLTEDYLLTGGKLLVQNGNIGDQIFMQVVHPVAGVLNEFVTGYRVASDSIIQTDINLDYPAKIPGGLIIRCKYVSNSEIGSRKIAVNLYLHKVLV